MDLTWLRELRELREVWLAMRAPRYWKRLRLLLLSGLGAGVAIYTVGLGTVSAWVGSASGAQGAAPTAWRFPALWLLVSFLVGMVLVSTFWVWRAERGGAHGDVLDYYREVPMHFGTIYEGTAFDVLATYGSLLVEPHDVGGWSSEIRGHLVSVATRDWQTRNAEPGSWQVFHEEMEALAQDMEDRRLLQPRVHQKGGYVLGNCTLTEAGMATVHMARMLAGHSALQTKRPSR